MEEEAILPFPVSTQADFVMSEVGSHPFSQARTHNPSPLVGSTTLSSGNSAGSVPNNPIAMGIQDSIEDSRSRTDQDSGSGPMSQDSQDSSDGMIVQLRAPSTHQPSVTQDPVEDELSASDMRQSTPPTNASAPQPSMVDGTRSTTNASTRTPTLRALLQRSTEIRRDNVEAPTPPRVEMPRPKVMDIEAIDALYEAGGDWSQLAASIDRARPYKLPRARYAMVIETGHAFQRTAPSKILASLLKDHGNPVVQQQIDQQELGQLTKAPGGNIRVKVKTKEACQRLAGQEVRILGGKYRFGEFDILADRFFIDVSSVDSDFNADLMLKRFFELGTQPIYGTFRDVNLDAVITTATWRVYFRSSQCPPELMVDGAVCDQLVFAEHIYPVHAKNAPFPTQRMSFGQRSIHALDLVEEAFTPSAITRNMQDLRPPQPSYATVVRRGTQETSLQRSIRESSGAITPTVLATARASDPTPSEISLGTAGSQVVSPPSSPKPSRLLLPPTLPSAVASKPTLMPANGGKRKGKRSRADEDFANMLMKSRPKPLAGVTTSNYFDVLSTVEVEFDCCPATLDEVEIPRFQIVPRKVQVPRELATSKEASHFLTKHRTNVVKTKEPTPIQEIVNEMETTEKTADLQLLPDRLAAADVRVGGLHKSLRTTNNPDTLTYMGSVKAPMAFNAALLRQMRELSPNITELAQLHMINRILSATDPTNTNTFAHKWATYLGDKVPKKREEVFRCVAQWWNNPDTATIVRATRALSLFELMLMCTAPHIFEKDYWLQHLTGWSVPWIPAHNRRLLHPNMLLVLLRSKIGAHCFRIWGQVQWQGDMLDDLEYLRDCENFFPENADVLQLQQVDGQLVAPRADAPEVSWQEVSLLTVNTNGIKKNGHLLIEHLLEKHSLSCVQETKLRDYHHLDTFKFNLQARFKHKLFVSDPGAASATQTSHRSGGVLTVLRPDFPGFDTAEELCELAVPGRYLVVRLIVAQAPVYIHNVYSPVEDHDKAVFFNHLSVDRFEDNATHIVLGDLNTPLNPTLDSSQPRLLARPGRSACMSWLGQLGVADAWRIHHPEERVYTGPQPRQNRLDYILLSEDFCNALYGDSKYFEPKRAGDHLAHTVTLRSMSQPHGYGYWRFPEYLLEYSDVVDAIRGEAQQVLEDLKGTPNPGKVWEHWKKYMRSQLQAIQRKLRGQNDKAITAAQATLDQAAIRYRTERDATSQESFQAALEAYRECVTRSRCYNQDSAFDFQVQNAEKSTRFFFRPLDPSLRRVSIEEVRMPGGDISRNPADISASFIAHWGSIMGDAASSTGPPPPTDPSSRRKLLNTIGKRLTPDDQDLLNTPISGADLTEAIKHMKSNSAPGMDGLTAGFYQVAPDVFGECLCIVFDYQLARGELLPSQRKSAVCMLHKKGSRNDPGNFRPISLIGVDVKALSKALTYRLQLFLPKLIHADQKAFVKGRSIHHHVRFMADLQDLVTARDEEAYAMFLDFEKAYDRVNWEYMFQVLERMGCGGAFTEWVKLLYTSPQAHLLLNGHVQPPIFPTRGVKQGDPLSALLFLMVIEPLGNLLRQHEEHGVCLTEDHTVTSVFFADDSTLLSSSVSGIQAQLELVQLYCDGSGARLNLGKCALMPLNRKGDSPSFPDVKVLQRGETVKFLGILFGQEPVGEIIVEFLDRRFYEGFLQWFRRARTLRGRLLIALTMVLSRLWHYTMHVPIPQRVVKQWQSTLNRFVLARRYERNAKYIQLIPKEFLYQPRSNGGLSIPSIEASLKRQKLSILLQFIAASTSTQRNWATPGTVLLSLVLPTWGPWQTLDFLTISPMRHGTLLQWDVLSLWWRQIWRLWYVIKWEVTWQDLAPLARLGYVLNQPLWFHADANFQFELATRVDGSGTQRRSLCMVAEPQRSYRQHIAMTFKLRCLADFLNADGTWPDAEAFSHSHIDYRLTSVTVYQQFQWLRRLHHEATQVFERLRDLCSNAPLPPPGVAWVCPSAPYVGVHVGERVCVVPSVPRSHLLLLVWTAPTPTKPHPIQLHDANATTADIEVFVDQSKHLRRLLLPIYEDLQFRLAFRLLPVRSRFSFLRDVHPDIIFCPHNGCTAVETERHLFFECVLSAEVWPVLLRDWSKFFAATPKWIDIALGYPPVLTPTWLDHAEVVHDLWQIMRCITLHLLWKVRNDGLFRQRVSLPLMPALRIVYTTFSAHVRACKRRVYDKGQQASLQSVLSQLRCSRSMGTFMRANTPLFTVRFL